MEHFSGNSWDFTEIGGPSYPERNEREFREKKRKRNAKGGIF